MPKPTEPMTVGKPESEFPTIRDLSDGLSMLVSEGLGDLPVQVLIVPDSTLQAIARVTMGAQEGDRPALMIELGDSAEGRIPVSIMSMETAWAIIGVHGLYSGTWRTRVEAIGAHLKAVVPMGQAVNWGALTPDARREWRYRQRKGDRAVKVEIRVCD